MLVKLLECPCACGMCTYLGTHRQWTQLLVNCAYQGVYLTNSLCILLIADHHNYKSLFQSFVYVFGLNLGLINKYFTHTLHDMDEGCFNKKLLLGLVSISIRKIARRIQKLSGFTKSKHHFKQ